MCKHVAAALYGIDTRLDASPVLFFKMHGIRVEELLKKRMAGKIECRPANAGQKTAWSLGAKGATKRFGVKCAGDKTWFFLKM
jgi:uncharacterized Zn finger protein